MWPIHPDDMEMLLVIRRYLIGYRITNNWNQERVSKMLGFASSGFISNLESSDFQTHFDRMQRWPEAFGLTLQVNPLFMQDHPDPEFKILSQAINAREDVAPFYALRDKSHQWMRTYLVAFLRGARLEQGITQEELGGRLKISKKAVGNWERDTDNMMLPKLLEHARVLGGSIWLGVAR